MTAPTPADIDAIRERHTKHRNEIWFTPETIDALLAAIAERDDTIERLTREAAIWDAQAGARHADVTAIQAEVARLTAERDEATAKERERIVAEIDDRIRGWQEHSSSGARKRALELQALKRDLLADRTIARGEPQGENDA